MMHEQINARRNVFNPGGDQIIYLPGPTSTSYVVYQSQMCYMARPGNCFCAVRVSRALPSQESGRCTLSYAYNKLLRVDRIHAGAPEPGRGAGRWRRRSTVSCVVCYDAYVL
jgi:hypothetical protein